MFTKIQWEILKYETYRKAPGVRASCPSLDLALTRYNAEPAACPAHKKVLLTQIERFARDYLTKGADDPLFFAVQQLHMLAAKDRYWLNPVPPESPAFKYLKERNPENPQHRALHTALRPIQDARPLHENYWIEVLDKKHRRGCLPTLSAIFAAWHKDKDTDLPFAAWLDNNDANLDAAGVEYVTDRWRYIVYYRRHVNTTTKRGRGRLTFNGEDGLADKHTQSASVIEGQGYEMYVCSPNRNFYSGVQEISRFHHSSFLAGGPVICAGTWMICRGRLMVISNDTGHYKSTSDDLKTALRILRDGGLDLSYTLADVRTPHGHDYYIALDWLEGGGQRLPDYEYVVHMARCHLQAGTVWDLSRRDSFSKPIIPISSEVSVCVVNNTLCSYSTRQPINGAFSIVGGHFPDGGREFKVRHNMSKPRFIAHEGKIMYWCALNLDDVGALDSIRPLTLSETVIASSGRGLNMLLSDFLEDPTVQSSALISPFKAWFPVMARLQVDRSTQPKMGRVRNSDPHTHTVHHNGGLIGTGHESRNGSLVLTLTVELPAGARIEVKKNGLARRWNQRS